MKNLIRASFAVVLISLAATASAHAAVVPEIDPSVGPGAVALLAGAIMVIRGRRKA